MTTSIAVTAVTVLKVLMASTIGSGISFALPEQTVKDLNFLNGNLFSPCFSFANLVSTLTWPLVTQAWVMFVFAFVTLGTAQLVGWLCAKLCCSDEWIEPVIGNNPQSASTTPTATAAAASSGVGGCEEEAGRPGSGDGVMRVICRKLVSAASTPSPKDYQTMYLVTLGTQNTGNFPIALLLSLIGNISWFDRAAYVRALSVIFVYTSAWTVFIWSISLWTVRRGSRARHKHALVQQQQRQRAMLNSRLEAPRHAASQDDLALAEAAAHAQHESGAHHLAVSEAIVQFTSDLLEVNRSITAIDFQDCHRPFSSPRSDETLTVRDSSNAGGGGASSPPPSSHARMAQWLASLNLPIFACLCGILCALIPPMKAVFDTSVLQVIVGGIALIGDGCVPVSLLVLGANLTSGGLRPLMKIDVRYLVVGTVAKTIVLPALNIAVFLWFESMGLIPEDPVLRIAVWVELIAPSAVMCTVLCRLEDYMAECATGLLLVQYVVAVFTTTAWLSLFFSMHSSGVG